MVPAAFGTQTGGSVLRPASYCGVIGYKPTYNAFNRFGVKPAAEGLDTIGLIARTLDDVALVRAVLLGAPPTSIAAVSAPPRIGLTRTHMWANAQPETVEAVEDAARRLDDAGAEIVEIALPDDFAGLSAPLLDRRLAEFAMAIPEEQRWSGRTTKRVLREAMAGMLPDHVRLWRPKADPSAVLFAEIRSMHDQGAFRQMELVEAGVLDGEAVRTLYLEMVRLSAAGQDRYKVLAYRLWTLFAGECMWRSLFGRRALTQLTHSGREGFSGRETPRAGFG
jgi:Asp-tRNA(Asn)/Glu-tRNA(Gln) amidotransferase A subunit family amidase